MTMSCEAVREHLLERARSSVSEDTRVDEHLANCADCRAVAREITELVAAQRARVEAPVDEAMLGRVDARLRPVMAREAARRRHRSSRWMPWLVGFAATTAVVAIAIAVMSRTPEAVQHDAVAIIAHDATANSVALQPNGIIRAGDTIDVHGSLLVSWGPQRLVGAAKTHMRFDSTDPRNAAMQLNSGRIVAHVEPVDSRPSTFAISWPDGDLVVRSTVFQVVVAAASSEVAVARGDVTVHVRKTDRWVVLHAGSALVLENGDAHERALADAERDAILVAMQLQAPAPEVQPPPAPPAVMPRGQAVAPAPKPRSVAAAQPAAVTASAEETARGGECAAATQRLDGSELAPAARGRALVAIADCFRGQDEVALALEWYERAAREARGTPAGENAAYDMARMLMSENRAAEADAAFATYLKDYPRGALAADASFNRCSFAVQDKRADDALACLRAFREHFPRNVRRRDTFLLEATVLRVLENDCSAALQAYDTYLADPGAYADEARSWKRWCERHEAEGHE